jgi:hypothetical protein
MPFVGLVSDPRWEPPDDQPESRGPHRRQVPWRALAWIAVVVAMVLTVPVADHALGPLAGYGWMLAAIAVAVWRIDRWCSRQYWRGLRDYQS